MPHPVILTLAAAESEQFGLNTVYRWVRVGGNTSFWDGYSNSVRNQVSLFWKYHEEKRHENDTPSSGSEGRSVCKGKTSLSRLRCGPRRPVICDRRGSGHRSIPRGTEVQGTKLGREIFRVEVGLGGWRDKY